nr:unnamed protein product [Callosobruchus analis]
MRYVGAQLHEDMRTITGSLRCTPLHWLPISSGITPPDLRRNSALLREAHKIDFNPIHQDIPGTRKVEVKVQKTCSCNVPNACVQ